MGIQQSGDGDEGRDSTGLIRVEANEGGVAANGLPKQEYSETYESRPNFDAPSSRRNGPQSWAQCRFCSRWRAAASKKIREGKAIYCTARCFTEHAKMTGRFAGANNPNWLGGVSNDNMRYRRRQVEREPEKEAARRATSNAIRSGRLVRQPCEKCGAAKVEAHHDDYTKPMDVRWLCRTHHVEHHQSLKAPKVTATKPKAETLYVPPRDGSEFVWRGKVRRG